MLCATNKVITTYSECVAAAGTLTLAFQSSFSSSYYPRGCFLYHPYSSVYYNTYSSGTFHYASTPICKTVSIYVFVYWRMCSILHQASLTIICLFLSVRNPYQFYWWCLGRKCHIIWSIKWIISNISITRLYRWRKRIVKIQYL